MSVVRVLPVLKYRLCSLPWLRQARLKEYIGAEGTIAIVMEQTFPDLRKR